MPANVRHVRVKRVFQFNFFKTLFVAVVVLMSALQLYQYYKVRFYCISSPWLSISNLQFVLFLRFFTKVIDKI